MVKGAIYFSRMEEPKTHKEETNNRLCALNIGYNSLILLLHRESQKYRGHGKVLKFYSQPSIEKFQ